MSNRSINFNNVKLTYREYDMAEYVDETRPAIFSNKSDSSLIIGCLYGYNIFPCKIVDDEFCVISPNSDVDKVDKVDSVDSDKYYFERYLDESKENVLPMLKPGLVFKERGYYKFYALKIADNDFSNYVLVEYNKLMPTYLFTSSSAFFKFIKDKNLILAGEQIC